LRNHVWHSVYHQDGRTAADSKHPVPSSTTA
jgi:NitT/TauT family transport system ATP-binding protein